MVDHYAINLDETAMPSLLIAFSEVRLSDEAIDAGALRWLNAGVSIRADNVGGSAAHLLRIKFPRAQ